jgi:HK97 family phage major capsid protein
MSDKIEALTQQLAELTETVKSGHEDPAVLDWERIEKEFGDKIDERVEARVQEQMDRQPARKGHPVYAHGVDKAFAAGELTHSNPFAPMVKHIATNGYYTDFVGNKIKATDLYLAKRVIQRMFETREHSKIRPPSDDLKAALKALTSTGTGTGDELVPTDMAAELWEDVHLSNVLASNLDRVPMTSNPLDLPNALGDVTFRKGTENVAVTASDPATAKNTLTVTEHVGEVDWSYSLDEDAVVALMPAVRKTIARNAAETVDGFVLNADSTTAATGNINSDDGAPAGDSYYLSGGQDGIRHLWIVDNSSQATAGAGAALTDAMITSTLVKMDKYAANPRDLLYICDVRTYIRGFLNATTSNAPGTFIKSEADVGYSIIATGQVASYRGSPLVIPTMAPRTEADGKQSVTSASNTLGQLSIVNRSQWKVGFVREVEIEVDRDIQKRQIIMVVSYRVAVGCRGTRSSAEHTAGILNILVT